MNDLMASIGLAQLKKINWLNSSRTKLIRLYIKEFKNLKNIKITLPYYLNKSSYWMFTILAPDPSLRDIIRGHLRDSGVETRPMFYPVHTMPMYSDNFQKYPVAENLAWRGINLPSFPDLKESEIVFICDIVNSAV
jgi:perosamine synthetase